MLDTNYKEPGKQAWLHRYSNVTEYYRDASAESELGPSRSSHSYGGRHWQGSDSWEETIERYAKGYPEGTVEANKLMLRLTPFLRTVRGTRRGWKPQRYAGGNFILDNYVKGVPEVCNIMSPVNSKKFVSLIINAVASCGIDSEVIQRRGIAMLALSQILEQNGYRVSIKLANGVKNHEKARQYCIVDLKPFNQTMELDRLAFFLTDTSAFRRLYFNFMECQPADVRRLMSVPGGYGQPCEIPASEIGANDIYLGCASFNMPAWRSIDGTIEYLKETLKRYGVEFYG